MLLVYLIGLVVVLPTVTFTWYSKSKKYGDHDVMYDTYGFFNVALAENLPVRCVRACVGRPVRCVRARA